MLSPLQGFPWPPPPPPRRRRQLPALITACKGQQRRDSQPLRWRLINSRSPDPSRLSCGGSSTPAPAPNTTRGPAHPWPRITLNPPPTGASSLSRRNIGMGDGATRVHRREEISVRFPGETRCFHKNKGICYCHQSSLPWRRAAVLYVLCLFLSGYRRKTSDGGRIAARAT